MRKNTENVFNAWMNGRSEKKQKSVWTDGVAIYSYNTLILFNNQDGALVFNNRKYSVTTSNHQNSIKRMCAERHIEYIQKDSPTYP